MARVSDVYAGSSPFLKATGSGGINIDGSPESAVLTVAGAEEGLDFNKKPQLVLSFKETDKKLGLNKTNANAMVRITGQDDDEQWVGQKVEVFATIDSSGKSDSGYCIRLRKPIGGGSKPQQNFTKATAWDCWKKKNDNLDAGDRKSKEDLGAMFKAAVEALGKTEAEFTSDDWTAIGLKADEALSDLPPW